MQVTELLSLSEWIRTEVQEAGIPALYQALQAKLHSNAQGSAQQPFEEEKDALFVGLRGARLQDLTNEQVRFLDCIGIGLYLGVRGVQDVEEILVRNPLDLATVASRLTERLGRIEEGIERAERLAQDLGDCVVVSESLRDGDVLVRVTFAGDAAIENVVDLRKWAEVWHGIARGITMAHGESPDDVRVIGASQGSIILDLATPETFAVTVTGIVYGALKVAEKVVQIQKQAHEVKGLKLANQKIAKDLETEARQVEKTGADEVTAEFTAKLQIDATKSGDVVTALGKAIADLVRFLRQGGEVDCVLPVPPDGDEDESVPSANRQEIAETLLHIRELERRLRELNPGDDNEKPG
jgi:hypothetical protein